MKEQILQTKIIKYLHSIGAYVAKINLATRSGVPDLLCCINGTFVAIEVKTKGHLSELQSWNFRKIQQAGGFAMVAHSLQDVENMIQKLRGTNG
ncbi:MAG: VRR-NUC domain-containing protein [Ignavibacteria bacterium]|nr:VRR-NUC domain-containing protein [Ignavibacteria bacterium]